MDIRQLSKNIISRSEAFASVIQACRHLLKYSSLAKNEREYIYKRISKHSVDKYGIGYFPSSKDLDCLIDLVGFSTLETLNLTKVFYVQERGRVLPRKIAHFNKHNLIFPYKDEYGNIVALVGRTLLEKQEREGLGIPKYKNSLPFHKKLHLYGLYYAKKAICKSNTAVIVEGQIDCINCHSHGYHNVVALAGSSLTSWQTYLLRKMADNIYLLLDNDVPGKEATEKILKKRYSKLANIKPLTLPSKFGDVDEYLCQSDSCDLFDKLTWS